jgi:hypothetical protein
MDQAQRQRPTKLQDLVQSSDAGQVASVSEEIEAVEGGGMQDIQHSLQETIQTVTTDEAFRHWLDDVGLPNEHPVPDGADSDDRMEGQSQDQSSQGSAPASSGRTRPSSGSRRSSSQTNQASQPASQGQPVSQESPASPGQPQSQGSQADDRMSGEEGDSDDEPLGFEIKLTVNPPGKKKGKSGGNAQAAS